jgi:peptide deformylase
VTKVSDWLVQDKEEHNDCLHRELFPVNIRLLKDNEAYWLMIHQIVDYMEQALTNEYDDYAKLQGISGANVGVPYNIILLNRGEDGGEVLLNPVIVRRSKKTKRAETNCGSLNLDKSIEVVRNEWVDVEYTAFDSNKYPKVKKIFKSATIQHEIDHNNGILITDASRLNSFKR